MIQIVPAGVLRFDQLDFTSPVPSLAPLLSRDGLTNIQVQFVPDKNMHAIFLGETVNRVILVLPCPRKEIAGNARVERSVATARQDVDRV
ncbi:MAG: hypothetical protein RJB62_2018 [Pseudomonadota bacterium]